ncbi:MAG TPA: endonuclease, partial [Casimicrobiaceae bacterium]
GPASPRPGAPYAHGIAKETLDALPAAPGVYEFYGDGELPLYIGKSIDIRARVLSHLREPLEVGMMRQTRRVEWSRTAGEIGALLLESRLIKARQPLFNQRLRTSRELCSWRCSLEVPKQLPALVFSRDVDFAIADDLYGLFVSAAAARRFLVALAEEHRLCLTALGLEAPSRRGCFGLQLGRCLGVCAGGEDKASHALRLLAALRHSQVRRWPFPDAVGIVERDGPWSQTHVVRKWCYERTLDDSAPAGRSLESAATAFDVDAYRILVKPLLAGTCELVVLP